MKLTLITTTLSVLLTMQALPASATDDQDSLRAVPAASGSGAAAPAASTPSPIQKAGGHIQRTGTRAVAAAERGVRKARLATERGIHKAGNVVGRGAQKAGNAVQRNVEKVTGPGGAAGASAPTSP